jgi:hypothetical protein
LPTWSALSRIFLTGDRINEKKAIDAESVNPRWR